MRNLVSRLQRELPDTDRDRYDIAYERGRAQARSALLFGGLAFGSLVGAVLMWLFDPTAGRARRAQLAGRATGLRNDLARTTSGRAEDIQNRVEGLAIERGIKEPPGGEAEDVGDDAGERGERDELADHDVRDEVTARWSDDGNGYSPEVEDRDREPSSAGAEDQQQLEPADVARFGAAGPVAGAASEVEPFDAVAERERQIRR